MAAKESFGIHDPAYRVSRTELLQWLNDLLQITYTKVEQCANGAAYCQIFDAIYAGDIPMKKVNFDAKIENDMIKNYKMLQNLFVKRQINKPLPVELLMKGKPLDNLEFLQWCKRFYDLNAEGAEYNATDRRSGKAVGLGDSSRDLKKASPAARGSPATGAGAGAVGRTKLTRQESSPAGVGGGRSRVSGAGHGGADLQRERDQMEGEVKKLKEEADELQLTVDTLEKERDFYFHKLREIEVLCLQVQEGKEDRESLMSKTMQILYATDENGEEPEEC